MVGHAQVKQLSPTDDLDKLSDLAALRYTKPLTSENVGFTQRCKAAKSRSTGEQLRFWLACPGLLLDILYVAFSPQQVLDTEKRFERVLPERRADAEKDCHYDPAQQRFDIVFSSLYPTVPGFLKILVWD